MHCKESEQDLSSAILQDMYSWKNSSRVPSCKASYAKKPDISSMFKIGEYFEGEEKPVVSYLKDAGIRVEQKA